ncbi:MAG: DUF6624 domain-containing protein [Planctomycetota bacterium]
MSMTNAVLLLTAIIAVGGCQQAETTEATPAAAQANTTAEPTHPELRAALLDLRERDQAARGAMVEVLQRSPQRQGGQFEISDEDKPIMAAVGEIDAESTAYLQEMIAKHGWPTFDMVGEDGASAAWILAQHADMAPELQAHVLELMEPLVEQAQAHGREFAMLTDRVRNGRGEPQVFGTQFTYDERGVQRPGPTIDWDTIDERRAKVGLPPIAEYAELIRTTYGGDVSPEPMPLPDE